MKLISLGAKTEIKVAELTLDDGRTKVLFSYGAPVAAFIPGRGFVRTNQVISKTTERHIATWTTNTLFLVEQVPSTFFNDILRAKNAEASSHNSNDEAHS
jgi:hypothetical protein